jgi:phosphoribosylglycinamide formyltransferase-1
MQPVRLGILGSGKGSNYVAIHEAIVRGELLAAECVVLSDIPDAGILAHAARFGVPHQFIAPGPFRTKLDPAAEARYVEALRAAQVDLVILAGFMRVIKQPLLDAFPDRILNIHPSLLPHFKGLAAWSQALQAGVPETGCTVHLVNADIDAGRILAQARVPVLQEDTAETLHARIQVEEHRLFPKAITDYWAELCRVSSGK